MLDHMKKPHTKVTLLFEGPSDKQAEAIDALKSLGFKISGEDKERIPWREAFPDYEDNEPGHCLAGGRHREGLTQVQLSKLTGIPQRHISEMERGKRPIGKKNAQLFSKALNVDYRMFL